MMRALPLLFAALALLAACRAPETLRYPHETPEAAAQAWADAFNRKEVGQLRLLVHPDRREPFDAYKLDLERQLQTYTIAKWSLGEEVVVNDKLHGRAVTLWFHDGTHAIENPAVLVFAEGGWWVWRY
jgi:hypothetical protein